MKVKESVKMDEKNRRTERGDERIQDFLTRGYKIMKENYIAKNLRKTCVVFFQHFMCAGLPKLLPATLPGSTLILHTE